MSHRGPILLLSWLLLMLIAVPDSALAQFKVKEGEKVQSFGLKPLCVPEGERAKFVFVDSYIGDNAKRPVKVLWIAFFASWCEPCKKELPLLNDFYKKYKDLGFQVLAVNIDKDPEEIEKAQAIMKAIKPEFPVLSDKMQIVTRRFFNTEKSVSLPATLVATSDGSILTTLAGADQKQLTAMEKLVREKIGAPALKDGDKGMLFIEAEDAKSSKSSKKLKSKHRGKRRDTKRKSAKRP